MTTTKAVSSKIVYQNNWMKVREDEVILPDGEKGIYGIVEKAPFALIIPFVGEKIALVEQFRYPVQAKSWEFPEGIKEAKDENIKKAAIRELQEETGLKTTNIEEIGILWLAPGHHTQSYSVFVAKDCTWGEKNLELSEKDMITNLFTLEEVKEMIKKGVIKDSPTVAAFGLFLLKIHG